MRITYNLNIFVLSTLCYSIIVSTTDLSETSIHVDRSGKMPESTNSPNLFYVQSFASLIHIRSFSFSSFSTLPLAYFLSHEERRPV